MMAHDRFYLYIYGWIYWSFVIVVGSLLLVIVVIAVLYCIDIYIYILGVQLILRLSDFFFYAYIVIILLLSCIHIWWWYVLVLYPNQCCAITVPEGSMIPLLFGKSIQTHMHININMYISIYLLSVRLSTYVCVFRTYVSFIWVYCTVAG